MTPPDRRQTRTRLALRDALLHRLRTQAWDALSISDLCQQANVGRSTYYAHYPDKQQLLADTMADLQASLLAQAAAQPPLGFLPGLVLHLCEQRSVFRAVVGRRGNEAVERHFRAMVCELLQTQRPEGVDAARWHTAARFIAGGWVELMAAWAQAPDAEPVQALQATLNRLAQAVQQQVEADAAQAT